MKVLLIELWGLGDAAIMTTALRPLAESGALITILCKPATAELLRPTYPQVEFLLFDAPWTVFLGKYRLWAWPWREIVRLLRAGRAAKFDAAASVRPDPRDHFLMWLLGATHRIGFPRRGSGLFLTRRLSPPAMPYHRVDLWRQIASALTESLSGNRSAEAPPLSAAFGPFLDASAYPQSETSRQAFGATPEKRRPVVGLHCGARMKVRRWDEKSFEATLQLLRREADFHLALFPDSDGYGRSLLPLADSCHERLSISELVADLASCDLLMCNDSGPGHIAAALGRPVLAIFGPGQPDWFRPYGEKNHVVIRDICPYRPCFDNCRFPQPICLTQLTPDITWPEIRAWFLQRLSLLPASLNPSL
jgi:ADP-heptose:LPS heptosyltransferase